MLSIIDSYTGLITDWNCKEMNSRVLKQWPLPTDYVKCDFQISAERMTWNSNTKKAITGFDGMLQLGATWFKLKHRLMQFQCVIVEDDQINTPAS